MGKKLMSHSNSATKVKGLILELYRCILTRLKILDCFDSWLRRFRELYLISPEAFADTRLYIIAGVVTVCLGKVAATTGAHWYIIFPTQCRPCVSVRLPTWCCLTISKGCNRPHLGRLDQTRGAPWKKKLGYRDRQDRLLVFLHAIIGDGADCLLSSASISLHMPPGLPWPLTSDNPPFSGAACICLGCVSQLLLCG